MSTVRTEVQNDLVNQIPAKPHGRILLAPRVGKSRIIINVIKREKPKSILWVTPSRKLAEENIPGEFVTWKAKSFLGKTKTTTWASLHKETGHYEMIILDEYQDITDANALPILSKQLTADYIVALSGTDPKHEEKQKLYSELGLKIIAKIDIDEAVDLGLIANYNIRVLEVDMDNVNKNFQGGSAKTTYFPQTEWARYSWLDKQARQAMYQRRTDMQVQIMKRMHFIKGSPSKEQAAQFLLSTLEGRTLVFCASIEQAERIFPESNYHSKSPNRKALDNFIAGETDRLALVNAGGVGETYTNVDHFVIIQADSDKKGLTTQKVARALLEQGEDYVASIWVFKLLGTQDDTWVTSFLSSFNQGKINYERFINFKNEYQSRN